MKLSRANPFRLRPKSLALKVTRTSGRIDPAPNPLAHAGFPFLRMRLHIILSLRRIIDLERVRDGNLSHSYRSQSPELLSSPGSICRRSARSVPTRNTPTPPPFSLHPHETKDVRHIIARFGPFCRIKQRTYLPQFSRLSKNKALTASTEGLHRGAVAQYRILQRTPTLLSL